jgi:hypothetical protein
MKGPAPGAAEVIGALPDLAKAFDVSVRLGYLAFQVRQNTRAVRAHSQRARLVHSFGIAAARCVISFGRHFRITRLNCKAGSSSPGVDAFFRKAKAVFGGGFEAN